MKTEQKILNDYHPRSVISYVYNYKFNAGFISSPLPGTQQIYINVQRIWVGVTDRIHFPL